VCATEWGMEEERERTKGKTKEGRPGVQNRNNSIEKSKLKKTVFDSNVF